MTYTAEGHARFVADPKTQDAVVRNLEIIVVTNDLGQLRDALTALIDGI